MPSIEEIEAWSVEDITSEIQRQLPDGVALDVSQREGWWIVVLRRGEDILWDDQGADRRLVLLAAFGWLWTRGKQAHHPAWRVRRGAEPARPTHRPQPGVAPNPLDLDPDELNAMFENAQKPKP